MGKNDLKMGDIVEVYDNGEYAWVKRIFIKCGEDNGSICVIKNDEKAYSNGGSFNTIFWGEWRIPKKPEYIPFTYDDYEQLIGRAVKTKDKTLVLNINRIGKKEGIQIALSLSLSYEHLLSKYTFLDGTPCGKLKE